jgi:branched-chain amino acid transport system permease protein
VGAYVAALTTNNLGLPPAVALVLATFIAGIFGLVLGFAVARLSGPYLAGTTLALAVSLPTIANQFEILGGEQGVAFDIGLPPARLGEEFSQYKWYFWICALAALIVIWFISNILASKYGRIFRALRDNPVAASLAGINAGRLKVMAFALSAGVAGLAGGLLVMLISGVSPSAFPLSLSFSLLTGAVVTGVYNLKGVMLGALVLVAIPEIAESVVSRIGGSEGFTVALPGFLVSALLILAVVFAPNGPGHLLHKKKH